MPSQPSVLVTLDGDVRDPAQPLLTADDLAAVRGDGVFETLLIRDGRACKVEAHLHRLARSAAMMDLPEPDLAAWRRAIGTAVAQWNSMTRNSRTAAEGALRLVCSRGRESGSGPTAYLMVSALADRVAVARRDGVAAVLLDRGLPAAGVAEMPWLLAGAKTLSYAVNMAALRHAAVLGADDVIFVSSDGYSLEDHIRAIEAHLDPSEGRLFDYVVANTGSLPPSIAEKYRKCQADSVDTGPPLSHYHYLRDDYVVMENGLVRHNADLLARRIFETYLK